MGREAHSSALLLLLTIALLNLQKVACGVSCKLECNGTTSIGDEYLMELETSTRILLANGKRTLVYPALQKPPICNERTYASCIGFRVNKEKRPCNKWNRCKHTLE